MLILFSTYIPLFRGQISKGSTKGVAGEGREEGLNVEMEAQSGVLTCPVCK